MFFVAAVGLGLAAATLGAFAGAYWWPLDLIANFRPQLGVGALVIGLWLLAARWRRIGGVVMLAALVNILLVGWLWIPRPVSVSADADPLRVLSFNILAANENYGDVLGFLRETNADVVFLHESSAPWEEAVATADLGYRIVKTRDQNHIFGTLVLVRGVADVEGFGFTEREARAVEVLLNLDSGKKVALLGVHPVAPVTEFESGLRDAQLNFATRWAASRQEPVVIAGDFNAGPWSYAFRRLEARGDVVDSQRGFGLQPSFPASSNLAFRIAIDHVLVSREIRVVDRRLGPAMGSDHFPVVVDLLIG